MEYSMYYNRIKMLEEIMEGSHDYKKIEAEIDELYRYKPVSLRLLAAKCKLFNSNNRSLDVIRDYSDLFCTESEDEDNIALWEQVISAYENAGMEEEAIRQKYVKKRLFDKDQMTDWDIRLTNAKDKFVNGDESLLVLNELEDMYFYTLNTLMAYCIFLYKNRVYKVEIQNEDRYNGYGNRGYLKERIENGCTITIVATENDKIDYDILSYILHKLNVSVYMITDIVSLDEEFDLKTSVLVSMDNSRQYEDCVSIPALAKLVDGKNEGDNIPYIIDYISKEKTEKDFSIVIGPNKVIEKLRVHSEIAKRFDRLSENKASYLEDKIGFGWSGDYYEYVSYIYGINVKEYVEREPSVKYSIVVPARNASATLLYTLKSCLDQDYDGEYEIVLSDNSTNGNTVVYDTYVKMDSEKIRYYKTPRDLNLTKSFEYAYLQTRGQYIIPIGADDAILPWGLRSVDVAWDKNSSNRNILCWDRGFYTWPGFNGGQENQFDIPSFYKRNNIQGRIYVNKAYTNAIKNTPSAMYSLPNLYLNSGFKRSYMKKLYENTGRLWDGYSQDVYVGLQNLCVEKEFLHIDFPITIAGMSSASLGALNSLYSKDNRKKDELMVRSGGTYLYEKIVSGREKLIPNTGDDVCGMYLCIEHLISKGILSGEFYNNEEEIKKMYKNCYSSMGVMGDKFMKNVCCGYEASKKYGKEIQSWFEQHILAATKALRYYDEKEVEQKRQRKMYVEGFNANGGITLDASRFEVMDVYGAAQLFKELLHF